MPSRPVCTAGLPSLMLRLTAMLFAVLLLVPALARADAGDAVIKDCIEELMDARLLLESVRSFVQVVGPKLQRR